MRRASSLSAALWLVLTAGAQAAFHDAPHPFMIWTRDEAAAIRERVEKEPWAKEEYARMLRDDSPLGKTFRELFRYVVMGDRKAGEAQRDYLLKIIGTSPRQFENLDQNGRHYDCYLDALRYDAVYDLLTPEQAKKVEDTFRVYIDYQLGDTKEYTRLSWLPNMEWPRPMAAHLMAVALKDDRAIRALSDGNGGWKWYLDEYIADGYFHNEEFGKHYSMIGEMLLFCRGLERLGLDDLGYGYTGRGGATVRRYLESIPRVGYPRTDIPGGRPRYGKVTMGDAKGGFPGGPRFLFQQAIVTGYLPDGSGGNARWIQSNMNGRDHRNARVDKMLEPLWFEIAQAKWPDAGFDYFLAQMRGPRDDKYYPSLYWGLEPIDPARVKPPPAPSYVAPQRGFALLRAEEGPAYWESPAPAVALQFATLYVHYLSDCFSLLGYQAFNRPIYVDRTISYGYAGGPWDFSVRSHCGVVVDGLQAQPVGPVPERHDFTPPAKFVSVRTPHLEKPWYTGKEVRSKDQPKEPATEVYPGVGLSRSLVLTREYLFDVYRLTADRPHAYHWLVHAPGEARPDDPRKWTDSTDLQKTLFDTPEIRIEGERCWDVQGGSWSLTTLQTCALPDVTKSKLGREWYDRKVGVRVSMLGEEGTTVYTFRTPTAYTPGSPRTAPVAGKGAQPVPYDEVGGVSVAVARTAADTTFVALHEPFEHGEPHLAAFERVAQDEHGVAARVRGKSGSPVEDRILVAFGDGPVTLAGGGESFTFTNYGYVRVGKERVEACGGLTAFRVKVEGRPALLLNGKEAPAVVADGYLTFGP